MFAFYNQPGFMSGTDLMRLGGELATLGLQTQTVIAYRLLGMSGIWAVHPSENARMVNEKAAAFSQSATAAFQAAVRGQSPDRILSAAIKPLSRKTGSNMRRLSRRGPVIPQG